MARTSRNLDSFNDVVFRDIAHRNQFQTAPSANIIQHLYTHLSGTTANVSAAEVVSVDGSNQGQWDLLLSGTTQRLNANTITTANTAAWSANSIMSVRQASTTIRSANVNVGNLIATSVSATSAVIGNTTSRSFVKTLGAAQNSLSLICDISGPDCYAFELAVVQQVSGASIAKSYHGTVQFDFYGTGWKRLIPLSSTGPINSRDWAVDISVAGATSQFRLVRVDTTNDMSGLGLVVCNFKIHSPSIAAIIADNTTTGTNAVNSGPFENTLVTQVDGRVGIGTDSPTWPLDVNGNINLSTGNTYHIAGTPVLSGTALGSGVLSSNLTSVGTLSSLDVTGNVSAGGDVIVNTLRGYRVGGASVLTGFTLGPSVVNSSLQTLGTLNGLAVNGATNVNEVISRKFSLVLSTLVNDGVQFCQITNTGGAYCLELNLIQSRDYNSLAKLYKFPVSFDGTYGEWRSLLPIVNNGPFATSNDLGIQIQITGAIGGTMTTRLRLVRLANGGNTASGGITITMIAHQSEENPLTITSQNNPTGVLSGSFPFYRGTLLCTSMDRECVGVNTETPNSAYYLDVNGRAYLGYLNTNWVDSVFEYRVNGAAVLTGTTLTPNVVSSSLTSVGPLSSLTVSGACVLNGPISGSGVTSSVADGSTALVTSGGVYSALSLVSGSSLAEYQTLSVGQSDNPGTFRVVGDASLDTSTGTFRGVVSASDQAWSSVCYGNGRYVAVSEGTANPGVMTSTDGRVWVTQVAAPSTGAAWKSVAFGNNWYVAIAANGSIMKSADGSTWTAVRTDTLRQMTSVAFGNNVFVAVSLDNNVLVGDNTATTWTLNTGIANQQWQSIAFGATQFVAVASSGVNIRVATSSNGTAWTSRFSAADLAWKTVSYGDGVFVALADAGTGRIMTSADDGLTWSLRTNPVSLAWTDVAYGAGRWLAVASDGTGTRAMTSVDGGVTWTVRATPVDLTWRAIVYGASEFAAVASSGTANRAMVWQADDVVKALAVNGSTSQLTIAAPNVSVVADSTVVQGNVTVQKVASTSSAMTWTTRTGPTTNQWQSVAYGNDLFVAVSSTGNVNRVMTSSDGYQWTSRQSAADYSWNCVAYGNLTFVAVSSTGTTQRVMTSANGVSWLSRSTPVAGDSLSWQSVAYGVVNGTGRFVAVASTANANNIMTSDDNGASWTIRTGPSATGWTDIAYGNGVFVVFSSSALITSPDGITWTSRTSPTSLTRHVTFGGGLFVVVQSTGTNRLFTSPDGVNWTGYAIELNGWQNVTYGNGLFVAVANTGTNRVVTSNNATTWTGQLASAASSWNAVAYGKGVFVAVANDTSSSLYDRIMTSPGFSNTVTTSPLLVVNTLSGNVGVGTASPAYELDVSGTVNAGGMRTGTISVPGYGLSFNPGQILDSTALLQGPVLGWNSETGAGRTDLVNKSGAGAGGFNFWNSTGTGSTFVTGRNLLAQMTPALVLVPNDLYCANSVGTSTSTAGYRFYYRQLAQPCSWMTSFVVTSQNNSSFFLEATLTDAPFCKDSTTTVVNACNGDPGANPHFYIYNAYLFTGSGTINSFGANSQPPKVQMWCRGLNTSSARVNLHISFTPI